MKTYIVLFQDWDINEIVAVYLKKENAEAFLAEYRKTDAGYAKHLFVEEYDVADEVKPEPVYRVTLSPAFSGEKLTREKHPHVTAYGKFDKPYVTCWDEERDLWRGTAEGRSYEEAEQNLRAAIVEAKKARK